MLRKCIRRWMSPWLFFGMALGCALPAAAQQPGCSTSPACSSTPDWPAICKTGTSIGKWQCWQKDLTSTGNYANGYRDVRISVTFTSAQYPAVTYHTKAFWNGKSGNNDLFAFRMAFGPYPGTWNWTATCASSYGTASCASDSGLNLSGTVTVTSSIPAGNNPIYQKGMLKQVLSMTAMGVMIFYPPSHFDITSFLWHGDTAWAASTQACRNQWQAYVDNRKANGFTVVHLALAPDWAGPLATGSLVGPLNKLGQAPFEVLSPSSPP